MTHSEQRALYLIGAGGHGKVILEIAESANRPVAGFIDAHSGLKTLFGYSVYHSLSEAFPSPEAQYVISIGKNALRKKIAEEHPLAFDFLVHPSAQITRRGQIGEGSVVMAGVCVNSSTAIGRHAILNTLCSVDHDCVIGDFAHISPRAALGGGVQVGEGTHVGIGVSVLPGIRIGKWCTIGAGAVIIRDVPDGATVVGVPGRVIKVDSL